MSVQSFVEDLRGERFVTISGRCTARHDHLQVEVWKGWGAARVQVLRGALPLEECNALVTGLSLQPAFDCGGVSWSWRTPAYVLTVFHDETTDAVRLIGVITSLHIPCFQIRMPGATFAVYRNGERVKERSADEIERYLRALAKWAGRND